MGPLKLKMSFFNLARQLERQDFRSEITQIALKKLFSVGQNMTRPISGLRGVWRRKLQGEVLVTTEGSDCKLVNTGSCRTDERGCVCGVQLNANFTVALKIKMNSR